MDTDLLKQLEAYADMLSWVKRRRWLTAGAAAAIAGAAAFAGYAIFRPLRVVNQAIKLRLALSGIRERFITLDGHRIHYYEGGPDATAERPPIVLVHGLGGYAEHWADLMLQFVAAHRRIYAMDLLGYGQSDQPKDASYSVRQEAGVVESFLRAKNIEEYDLCGWSMGGWIALQMALDQNCSDVQRLSQCGLKRLVLLDSAGLVFNLEWDAGVFVPDTPEKLHALNDLLFPDAMKLPGFVAKAVMREAQRDGWVIQRSMDSMLAGLDIEEGKLRQLKQPVLIIWGREDRIIPVSVGERLHAEIAHSELEIYENCGHLAPVNCAEKIGQRILAFLDAHPLQGDMEKAG